MRIDAANRSFAALFGTSLLAGMLIVCGAVGCVLLGLLAADVASDGLGSLIEGRHWTALAFIVLVGAGTAAGLRSFVLQSVPWPLSPAWGR